MNRICIEPGCIKKAAKGHRRCGHHNMQRYRDKSPIRYVWMTLKHNARRRGKLFSLQLEEFTNFLIQNPLYMQLKGTFNKSLQIDRIVNYEGYYIGNIRVIPKEQNTAKYFEQGQIADHDYEQVLTEDDLPF